MDKEITASTITQGTETYEVLVPGKTVVLDKMILDTSKPLYTREKEPKLLEQNGEWYIDAPRGASVIFSLPQYGFESESCQL